MSCVIPVDLFTTLPQSTTCTFSNTLVLLKRNHTYNSSWIITTEIFFRKCFMHQQQWEFKNTTFYYLAFANRIMWIRLKHQSVSHAHLWGDPSYPGKLNDFSKMTHWPHLSELQFMSQAPNELQNRPLPSANSTIWPPLQVRQGQEAETLYTAHLGSRKSIDKESMCLKTIIPKNMKLTDYKKQQWQ